MEKKFSKGLFASLFFTNMFIRNFWLVIAALILFVAGIFNSYCLIAGGAFILVDIIVSLVSVLNTRKIILESNGEGDFGVFCDAVTKDTAWRKNIMQLVEDKMDGDGTVYDPDDNGEKPEDEQTQDAPEVDGAPNVGTPDGSEKPEDSE